MSSILKALKKLENETDQGIGGDTWPHTIDAGKALHKRTRRFPLLGGPFLVGLGILGIGIAAALFYFPAPADRPAPQAASVSPAPLPDTPEPAPAPPPMTARRNSLAPLPGDATPIAKAAPSPKSGSGFPTGQSPEVRQPKPANTQVDTRSASQELQTPPSPFHRTAQKPDPVSKPPAMPPAVQENNRSVRTAPPVPPPSLSRKSMSGPSSALSRPVPTEPQYEVYREKPSAAGPQPADPTPNPIEDPPAAFFAQGETPDETANITAHASIPEKSSEETGLQIQALVWSSEPADRMAVINGNIVKQGGNLEGGVLSFIGEDYILIQQEGREWKVRFQLK